MNARKIFTGLVATAMFILFLLVFTSARALAG